MHLFNTSDNEPIYALGKHSYDGSPDYLQWWYFDAELDSGHHVMMILMPNAFGEINDEKNGPDPGITFTIRQPNGHIHSTRHFYPKPVKSEAGTLALFFDETNSIVYKDSRFYVSINQGNTGCKLVFSPQLPPWMPFPGRGGFMCSPLLAAARMGWTPGLFLHYIPMVPRADVSGTLSLIPGESIDVEGKGYHEQGRLNSPFQRVFTYWYWTRFFLGDWTFVFPVAQAPRHSMNAVMRALLVYYKDELVVDMFDISGLFLHHSVVSFQEESERGHALPRSLNYTARRPGFRLSAQMTLEQELTRFSFKPFRGATDKTPGWYQHLSRVKVSLTWKGEDIELNGQGVFETMLTGAE